MTREIAALFARKVRRVGHGHDRLGAMWIVATILSVLGLAVTVDQVRRGRRWEAGGVLLSTLAMLALFLSLERESTSLFWLFPLLLVAGFGAEGMAYWTARKRGNGPLNTES
ncbi:hypothetical protein ACIQNU_26010 [Streptomyces sp. NPDC091292]|uniref:hypothetical protein n=1 Tax=Streptomyces sp. NPDC091292 TaxID=3365991 RepID=UPI0037FB8769